MKVLLTGFDPFGGETVNPAWEAVSRVRAPQGMELRKIQVPTLFAGALEPVAAAMEGFRPDVVLCVGQAGGRTAVTPERIGVNLMDATIADNSGFIPQNQPIVEGGPDGLFATVDVKAMAQAIRQAGIPSQVSNSAGTFVCNRLLYGVLHLCREKYPGTRAGFVHVPFLPRQTTDRPGCASMSLPDMVTALEAALGSL